LSQWLTVTLFINHQPLLLQPQSSKSPGFTLCSTRELARYASAPPQSLALPAPVPCKRADETYGYGNMKPVKTQEVENHLKHVFLH
jgi:hypothetical protein